MVTYHYFIGIQHVSENFVLMEVEVNVKHALRYQYDRQINWI